MFEFKLPDLGEGVHEGEILDWFVTPGDQIKEDDPLVEIETDKAAVTIPSPKAGRVVSVAGAVGDVIAVGAVLVAIDEGQGAEVEAPSAPAPQEHPAPVAPAAVAPAPVAPAPVAPAPAAPAPVAPAPVASAPVAPAPVAPAPVAPAPVASAALEIPRTGPVPAAPSTRRLARELSIDINVVPGSGPAGRVTGDDLRRFAEGGAASPAPAQAAEAVVVPQGAATTQALMPAGDPANMGSGIPYFEVEPMPDFQRWGQVEREPLRSIRRKVAQKMVASMVIVPHVAHMDEADITDLDVFRKALNKKSEGVKYTLLPFILKAVVAQLRRAPKVNASIDPHRGEIVYKRFYNIGFAADTPKGLLVPVIHDADRKSVSEIAAQLNALATKARDGKLELDEMQGGTFTITNLGSLGGTFVVPTINYPEVAILGLGRAVDKPVVRDGEIVVRKMLPMTIAYDHRLVDGADAARFLGAVIERIADPARLLVEI